MASELRRAMPLIGLLAVLGAGCETATPPVPSADRPRAFIGVVRVMAGANVFLNGQPVATGTSVFHGDEVSTGPGSSVRVDLAPGGFAQLDANTDPSFEFLRAGACTLVRMVVGQQYLEARDVCLGAGSLFARFQSTRVNWRIADGRSTLTVLDGSLLVERPARLTLHRGQQVTIAGDRIGPVKALSAIELANEVRWLAAFGGPPPPIAPPPAPPTRPAPPPPPPQPRLLVPDVLGQTLDGAGRTLRASGLDVGSVSTEPAPDRRIGAVFDQTPPPGAAAQPGTRVDLRVAAKVAVLTPEVAKAIVDVLDKVTVKLNDVIATLNARRFPEAATGIKEVRETFAGIELEFQGAEAARGSLRRLYELVTEGRDLQRRAIDLIDLLIRQETQRDPEASTTASAYARVRGEFKTTVTELKRIVEELLRRAR